MPPQRMVVSHDQSLRRNLNGLDEDDPVVDASPENGLDEENPEVDASQGNGLDEDDSDPKVDAPEEKEKVWKCEAERTRFIWFKHHV